MTISPQKDSIFISVITVTRLAVEAREYAATCTPKHSDYLTTINMMPHKTKSPQTKQKLTHL